MKRQSVGVVVLAVSVVYSLADLLGWLRPYFLRWRAHPGTAHTIANVLDALSFKAMLLLVGIVLAFWPSRAKPS
jgi:hypothetical protein